MSKLEAPYNLLQRSKVCRLQQKLVYSDDDVGYGGYYESSLIICIWEQYFHILNSKTLFYKNNYGSWYTQTIYQIIRS